MAYQLDLPPSLQGIHKLFYVSNLHKYVHAPDHIFRYEPPQIKENLTFVEELVYILERKKSNLRNKTTPYVKFLWKRHKVDEATLELEYETRENYPILFTTSN